MRLSYIIITHNRREVLLRSLDKLRRVTPLAPVEWEAILVDNASTDGTERAVAERFPWVRLVSLRSNLGCAARNHGAAIARGEWIVFLDDDSRPREGAIEVALRHLSRRPDLAMLGGRIWLPGGVEEASAVPLVPPACGMIVRRSVFAEVGGFCPVMFRQAEEYDLAFRVLAAGYEIERQESVSFDHDKTPRSRDNELIASLDLRNNLLLASRYLSGVGRVVWQRDWLRRYTALLRWQSEEEAIRLTLKEFREIRRGEQKRAVAEGVVARILDLGRQDAMVKRWARDHGVRRVVIADYTKTIYSTWSACRRAGLDVVAVTDSHPAYVDLDYRGVPIINDQVASGLCADGVVLSNINPARVGMRAKELEHIFQVPVLRLWPQAPCCDDGLDVNLSRASAVLK